ncbi:DUF481 domain-containing protein [Catenovulum sediminis]|uniref:DUF481 domain-containing protein n=1 Tax=Catenovulum sediminis TaxID=1740262 RepID=A0ABV1RD96_9ALTE
MSTFKLTSLACLICASLTAHAKAPLEGEVELGVITTSGNTETTSLKGKVGITHDLENWKNQYQLDALYKKDEVEVNGTKVSQTTAQKVFVSGQGDYKLNAENAALFVYASYEDDKFSGFEYQSTVAVGYSDQLFSNEHSFLNYNIGPGYTFSKLEEGDKEESAVLRLAATYQYKLSDNAKFSQKLSTEAALESGQNTRSKSETAVSANLMGNLSMKAAYTITHNSDVKVGKEKTDTTTSITVVYLF